MEAVIITWGKLFTAAGGTQSGLELARSAVLAGEDYRTRALDAARQGVLGSSAEFIAASPLPEREKVVLLAEASTLAERYFIERQGIQQSSIPVPRPEGPFRTRVEALRINEYQNLTKFLDEVVIDPGDDEFEFLAQLSRDPLPPISTAQTACERAVAVTAGCIRYFCETR